MLVLSVMLVSIVSNVCISIKRKTAKADVASLSILSFSFFVCTDSETNRTRNFQFLVNS